MHAQELTGNTLRVPHTQHAGAEDVSITKMQANLSNCIEGLANKQKQTKLGPNKKAKKIIIPWRASKLTLLLRDKIGGQNLTLMVGAISPASAELANSRRTLEFLKICGELRQLSGADDIEDLLDEEDIDDQDTDQSSTR